MLIALAAISVSSVAVAETCTEELCDGAGGCTIVSRPDGTPCSGDGGGSPTSGVCVAGECILEAGGQGAGGGAGVGQGGGSPAAGGGPATASSGPGAGGGQTVSGGDLGLVGGGCSVAGGGGALAGLAAALLAAAALARKRAR